MANFFKSIASDGGLGEKNFLNSKTSCASLRFNNHVNMTRNTNMPVVPGLDHDPTVSPLTKEIDSRLKVLNKILPHEEVVQLSQDFINKLNSACYDKIAETVCSNSAAPSIYGGANSVCNSIISQKINSRSRVLNGAGVSGNKESVANAMFRAAKNIRTQIDLGTINEEPQPDGLYVHSTQNRSKIRQQRAVKEPVAAHSSQNGDDSVFYRKPAAPGINQGQRSKKNNSQTTKTNSRRRKINEEVDMSVASCDLTITKTSLRSNTAKSKRKVVAPNNHKRTPPRMIKKNNLQEESESFLENGEAEQREDDSILMRRIQSRPKKTALSPFFSRFTQRCSAHTSTPLQF